MTYNEEKRKKCMRTIINKGNYQYNMCLIAKGQNPVGGKRIVDIEKYVACKNCFGLYIKKHIYSHYKRCVTVKGSNEDNLDEIRTTSREDKKNCMLPYVTVPPLMPQASEALQNDIIKHMIKDDVSLVAQSDPLILSFGSRAYDGGKVDSIIRNVISKMRVLSRILILMKERNKDIQTFEDCFSPVYFNDIIDVLKKYAEPDSHGVIQSRIVMVRPSLMDCAYILKELITKTDLITTEERDTRLRLINDFIELIMVRWKQEFGYKYDRNSRMEILQLSVVPNSDDIVLAFKHITELYDSLIKQLKSNPTTENFCVLAKKCIVQIAILNRRKPDEISHALLDHYNEKSNLSEAVVSENCVKFRVPGTSCEEDNCVLTKPMNQAVDALIAARDQLNITSKYLFPKPTTLDICEEQQVIDGKVAVNEVRIHIRFLMKKPQHFLANTIVNHGVNQKILLQTIVPETHSDDVTMAFAFIAKSYELLIRELEADPTPARYCVLAKRCIAHLIILNRCKQSEVTETLLDEYKQITETMTATTDSVQVYRFQRLRKNQVTLFLNNQIKMAIDTLVSSRESLQISSKYLFARLNTFENTNEEVFNGEEIINGLAKTLIFQLKVPDNFTVANLRYHKVEKKRLLEFSVPRSEDIVSLFIIIAKVYETLKTELKENPTVMKYCKLAKMCIAHLIILNRCEQTEVIHILLQNYEQIRNVSGSREVFDFPGSKSESTPLVLSKLMKEAIDALISVRNQLGIISKYLFALPNGNEEKSVFSAEQAVKALKHMNTNQIKQSFNFTADALRNHNVNQETLLGKSLVDDSASVSGNLADPGTKQKNMTCSTANPSKKIPTKSSISIDITENPDLTESATERIGIKDSSAKKIILPEKHTSLEKTVTEAEQSDGQAPKSSQECTFASKFANFCLPVINSDSDSEDSYRTPIIRRRWSDEEKEVVYKYFGRHLLNLQNPGRQEISKMVQREPVLKNRSLDQVNVYVNNIVTEKVKLTPYVIKRIKELSS